MIKKNAHYLEQCTKVSNMQYEITLVYLLKIIEIHFSSIELDAV